jgi:hypothetical protein
LDLGVIIISFTQLSNQEHTEKNNLPVGCDQSPWIDKARPVRYYYDNDPDFLQCAWTAKHTAVRMLIAALGIVVAVLFFVGGIIRHRRWLTILMLLLGIAQLAGYGYTIVTDSISLAAATTFCNEGLLPEYNAGEKDKIRCDNVPFLITIVLQIGAVLVWIVATGLGFRYVAKHMNKKSKDKTQGQEPLLSEAQQ